MNEYISYSCTWLLTYFVSGERENEMSKKYKWTGRGSSGKYNNAPFVCQ